MRNIRSTIEDSGFQPVGKYGVITRGDEFLYLPSKDRVK